MADASQHDDKPSLLKRLTTALRGGINPAMRESVAEVMEASESEDRTLSPQEQRMLANLLKFGELRVADVMVPRADIVAVEEKTPLCDLVALFREAQHSRLPVYRETLDDPVGLMLLKDVVGLIETEIDGSFRWRNVPIATLRRNLLFVPPSMPLLDLLLKMQASHTHLALVIDEYGGTDGLVTIEDIIEEIVGDIEDEHDEELQQVRNAGENVYVADARTSLEHFAEVTGLTLAPEDAHEDVDTLGGLVVSILGRVPERGEIVPHPSGYEFEVLEADPRRVKRLRIRATPKTAAPEQA
ncbi:MAG TPA: hemolysin family protein [Rhizomicrobium sp.]|jgi:magnesium and cobalt transporter|nr:hemolysin family protein [Rhizomicrobium sp.]